MIRVTHAGTPWTFAHGAEKLRARARLPGASTFDAAAHALRLARARGLPPIELLPLALGSSWLVNNPVASPVFRRWLTPPLASAWAALLAALAGDEWSWRSADRSAATGAVATLAVDDHGAGAISKVLALLLPESVPLMPDAAVWFAVGGVARPVAPDAQTAPATAFAPMMGWFTEHGLANEAALEALADAHEGPPLHGAQVLDRLLWFDSVGHRHFRTKAGPAWWDVTNGAERAVVPVSVPFEGDLPADGPIDLRREDLPAAWREAATRALSP